MHQISTYLPGIGSISSKTYAAWPVWRDSTTQPVKHQPVPKRLAVRLYHKARRFERQTRRANRQDGAIGRNGLAVLHALLFDFMNYASGRLDPSYERIANKACISLRSVARGLASLKASRVLNWVRRCREDRDDLGRFRLRQESNAYAVLPATQWRGYIEVDPPPPEPWQLGAVPPLPEVTDQAAADRVAGGTYEAQLAVLEGDAGNKTAAILARLGRRIPE